MPQVDCAIVFELIGETLRRLRKESGKTLAQLGSEAQVGKGQLSRIENGKQEATFGTLERVLAAHGISRQEFFRRYDLVEAEASALRRGQAPARGRAQEPYPVRAGRGWPGELRDALGRIESFVESSLRHGAAAGAGTVEIGDVVVVFRVLPEKPVPTPSPRSAGASRGAAAVDRFDDSKPESATSHLTGLRRRAPVALLPAST